MAGMYRNAEEHARQSAAQKHRRISAKAHAAAEKKWRAHVTAAAAGTLWRVTASWIQQADGVCCAELTSVTSGKTRQLRVPTMESIEACREHIQESA